MVRLAEMLLWIVAFLFAFLLLFYLASDWILTPRLRRYLQDQTGAAVFLEKVRWTGPFTLRLNRLVLAEDAQRPRETLMVDVEQADCFLSWSHLLRLDFQPRWIRLKKVVVEARYNPNSKQWNLSRLGQAARGTQPRRLPDILLDAGTLRVQKVEQNKRITLAVVDVQGRLKKDQQQYQVLLEASPAGMFAGSRLEGIWHPQDTHARLHLDGRIRMPLVYIFGNAWNLDDFEFDCSYGQQQIRIERLSGKLGQGQFLIRGQVSQSDEQRHLSLQAELENLTLSPDSRPDMIVYSEPILEIISGGLERFLRRYQPRGTADASVQIDGSLADLANSQVVGKIVCRNITIRDQKFPYRLEQIHGDIDLTGRGLMLNDLQAHNGPSKFTISGRITNFGPQAQILLKISSDSVLLNDQVKQALPERLQQKWFELAPSGQCGFDYQFVRRPGDEPSYRAVIRLQNVNCLYDRYPYPLTNLTGTLVLQPDVLTFQKVLARPRDGQEIQIEGTIKGLRQITQDCDVQITARGLPLDSTLRNTFRKPMRRILSDFEADGHLDLDLRIRGIYEQDRPLPSQASFGLEARRLVWKRFPLECKQVLIQGSFEDGHLRLQAVGLTPAGGSGQLIGHFWTAGKDPNQPAARIALAAEDVPLDSTFWQAFEQTGLYPQLFSRMQAAGTVDAEAIFLLNNPQHPSSITTDTSPDIRSQFRAHLKEGFLYDPAGTWKTGPAEGTLTLEDGRLALHDWKVRRIPLQQIATLWQGGSSREIAGLEPTGLVDGNVDWLRWNPNRPEPSLEIQGRLEIQQGGLRHLSLSDVQGFCQGTLLWKTPQKVPTGTGQFRLDSLRVFHKPLSDVQGVWSADPNSGMVIFQNVRGRCMEGRFLSNLSLNFSQQQIPFHAETAFEEIPVHWLWDGSSTPSPQHATQGLIRGSVNIQGKAAVLEQSEGKLTIEAEQLKLGRETLLGKALMMMQIRQTDEFLFNQLFAEALLKGRRIECERILLAGKNDVYHGQGRLDLAEGTVQMVLTAFGRRRGQEPTLWTGLAENLGAALARVEISGTLAQPVITQIPLPLLPRPF